jgi:hypothetical protein
MGLCLFAEREGLALHVATNKNPADGGTNFLAEREGFEPSVRV